MGNGKSTGGGNDWSNTNDGGWSSWQNTNDDDWSSRQNADYGGWSSSQNVDSSGGAFLRQLFENRDLPSSSINDLRDRYSDLPPSLDDFLDRYRRGRSSSRTPPTSPRRRSLSPPSPPDRYAIEVAARHPHHSPIGIQTEILHHSRGPHPDVTAGHPHHREHHPEAAASLHHSRGISTLIDPVVQSKKREAHLLVIAAS